MMKRREFITLLGGTSVAAGGTRAVADSAKSLHGTCAGIFIQKSFSHMEELLNDKTSRRKRSPLSIRTLTRFCTRYRVCECTRC